jgi:hypothetical protein
LGAAAMRIPATLRFDREHFQQHLRFLRLVRKVPYLGRSVEEERDVYNETGKEEPR